MNKKAQPICLPSDSVSELTPVTMWPEATKNMQARGFYGISYFKGSKIFYRRLSDGVFVSADSMHGKVDGVLSADETMANLREALTDLLQQIRSCDGTAQISTELAESVLRGRV